MNLTDTSITITDAGLTAMVNGRNLGPAAQPGSVTEGKCPSWCTGGHTENGSHLSANCLSWCTGHPGNEDEMDTYGPGGLHTSSSYDIMQLSVAEPFGIGNGMTAPAYALVEVWKQPRTPAPVVTIRHVDGGGEEVDFTPAEAREMAEYLMRAADIAEGTHPADGQ